MKFEDAVKFMLREGATITREKWPADKCMFVNINPHYHARYLICTHEWDNEHQTLLSEDILAEDWYCRECPSEYKYQENIQPATVK
jgi:hypothetical protein